MEKKGRNPRLLRNVDKARNAFDKAPRRGDCRPRLLGGNLRAGAGFVIGNRFELIGLGKKRTQLAVDARVVFGEPSKLALNG